MREDQQKIYEKNHTPKMFILAHYETRKKFQLVIKHSTDWKYNATSFNFKRKNQVGENLFFWQ